MIGRIQYTGSGSTLSRQAWVSLRCAASAPPWPASRIAPQQVSIGVLRSVPEAAIRAAPAAGHYVFDDRRHVRKHVAVFVKRQMVQDRTGLDQRLRSGNKVLVVQALTGD